MFYGLRIDYLFTAVFAVENRDRNAPGALAGNTPVTAVFNHARNTVLAPGGYPFNRFYRLNGFIGKIRNRAEPLFGRAENYRLFATPAMGVLVGNFLNSKKVAGRIKLLSNCLAGIVNMKTRKLPCFIG